MAKQLRWTGANRRAAQLQGWDVFINDHPPTFTIDALDDPHGIAKHVYGTSYKGRTFTQEYTIQRHISARLAVGCPLMRKAIRFLEQENSRRVKPVSLYHVYSKDHGICMVVGAATPRGAALIVATVIAEASPPGIGGLCCVIPLAAPADDHGKLQFRGYHIPPAGCDVYFKIKPNRVTRVPTGNRSW